MPDVDALPLSFSQAHIHEVCEMLYLELATVSDVVEQLRCEGYKADLLRLVAHVDKIRLESPDKPVVVKLKPSGLGRIVTLEFSAAKNSLDLFPPIISATLSPSNHSVSLPSTPTPATPLPSNTYEPATPRIVHSKSLASPTTNSSAPIENKITSRKTQCFMSPTANDSVPFENTQRSSTARKRRIDPTPPRTRTTRRTRPSIKPPVRSSSAKALEVMMRDGTGL